MRHLKGEQLLRHATLREIREKQRLLFRSGRSVRYRFNNSPRTSAFRSDHGEPSALRYLNLTRSHHYKEAILQQVTPEKWLRLYCSCADVQNFGLMIAATIALYRIAALHLVMCSSPRSGRCGGDTLPTVVEGLGITTIAATLATLEKLLVSEPIQFLDVQMPWQH